MAKVILLAHTPNPEQTVAAAAKLCYSSSDITGLTDSLTDEKAAAFVEMLSEIGHESPIEHASFTFGKRCAANFCSDFQPLFPSHCICGNHESNDGAALQGEIH